MHRSFILSITFTSNVGQLCKNWPINQTLKAILFIDLPPNNIFVYKLSYSGSKLLNRFFLDFVQLHQMPFIVMWKLTRRKQRICITPLLNMQVSYYLTQRL